VDGDAAAVRPRAADPSAGGAAALEAAPTAATAGGPAAANDIAALFSDLRAHIAQRDTVAQQQLQRLGERLDRFEALGHDGAGSASSSSSSRSSAHGGSAGYSSDDSRSSSRSGGSAAPLYTEFVSGDNPHYLAKQLRGQSHTRYGRPGRRFAELRHHEAMEILSKGRGSGGPLQTALEYGESVCAYSCEALLQLDFVLECLAKANVDDGVLDALESARNTLYGCYHLNNEQRAMVVEKARTMGPDAED